MKKLKSDKVTITISLISIAFLVITFFILWTFTQVTKILVVITILSFFLLIINGINIYFSIFDGINKKKESIPLMKFRMNKGLNIAIILIGIGIPLFLDAYFNGGLIINWIKTIFSITFTLIGIIIWEREYEYRSRVLEQELIKQNIKNR